jgi:hypothetical protein
VKKKVEMERNNKSFIGDINELIFLNEPKAAASASAPEKASAPQALPSVKPHIETKYDWYQNKTHVFVSFKVVGDKELSIEIDVKLEKQSVKLTTPSG